MLPVYITVFGSDSQNLQTDIAGTYLNYSFNRINWSAAGFWNVTLFVSNSDVDLNLAAVAWVFAVIVLINGPFLGKNYCKYCEEKTRRSEKLLWRVISVLHVEFNCSHKISSGDFKQTETPADG